MAKDILVHTELLQFSNFFENTQIPILKNDPLTFLAITKQPHYENVWSNIYAFFFDTKGEHRLGNLFINSLERLINKNESKKDFTLNSEFKVETEYYTDKRGKIDLLLYNSDRAIIIENKVNHILNNDLDDYWNSIKQEEKQGIILSKRKYGRNKIKNANFINITHLELLECIMDNMASYITGADDKYLIFLKDFYQNIINETNSMDKEIIEFYCEHTSEIEKIKTVGNDFLNYIRKEVEEAYEVLKEKEPFILKNKYGERLMYYAYPENDNLMITVVYEDLFKPKKNLHIIVELQGELLKRRDEFEKKLDLTDEEKKILQKRLDNRDSYIHVRTLTCEDLDTKEILNLSSYISNKIENEGILSIYRKLKALI